MGDFPDGYFSNETNVDIIQEILIYIVSYYIIVRQLNRLVLTIKWQNYYLFDSCLQQKDYFILKRIL